MSEAADITFKPIGNVEGSFYESAPAEEMQQHPSRLVIREELVAGLDGLAAGDRILVLFHFDRAEGYLLRRHPRGDTSRPIRGVFALRSQYRPNPIGVTVARIESVEDNVLHVTGLDALNGTPILDIKPYVDMFDAP
jgi:tRNA-Thr(GGU) m(6)t(6)A37 methyltransferase TsaA